MGWTCDKEIKSKSPITLGGTKGCWNGVRTSGLFSSAGGTVGFLANGLEDSFHASPGGKGGSTSEAVLNELTASCVPWKGQAGKWKVCAYIGLSHTLTVLYLKRDEGGVQKGHHEVHIKWERENIYLLLYLRVPWECSSERS